MNLFFVNFSLLLFVVFTIRTAKSQCQSHCTESKETNEKGQCNAPGEVILRAFDCAFMKKNGTTPNFVFVVAMNDQTAEAKSADANEAFLCCKATRETATLFILGVANKRLLLAKDVANYKVHKNMEIDDFEREKELLEKVSAQAKTAGIGDSYGTLFFQDQMDANKIIQKGYVKRWTEKREPLPEEFPDLVKVTRPKVTAATEEMILALKAFQQFREMADCWQTVQNLLEKPKSFLSLAEPEGSDAMRKAAVRLCAKVDKETVEAVDKRAEELLKGPAQN